MSSDTLNDHGKDQFKPNTTVAAVVTYQDLFLLVEEIENGRKVLNQPAGHIEANESLVAAATRELKEETGLSLSPDYLSGIYYFQRKDLDLHFLRFCFVFNIEGTSAPVCKPEDEEIINCHWLTLEEIKQNESKLRSAMVLECIEDYLSGQRVPLSVIKSNLST